MRLQYLGSASGTEKLEEAVSAYREALKELMKKAAFYYNLIVLENLDRVSALLAQRRKQ